MAEKLSELGYLRVPRVTVRGEFTLRGEVLDIFPAGSKYPFRIDFFDTQIEQMHRFDLVSFEKLEEEGKLNLPEEEEED